MRHRQPSEEYAVKKNYIINMIYGGEKQTNKLADVTAPSFISIKFNSDPYLLLMIDKNCWIRGINL